MSPSCINILLHSPLTRKCTRHGHHNTRRPTLLPRTTHLSHNTHLPRSTHLSHSTCYFLHFERQITPGGAAAVAGLSVNDRITFINGEDASFKTQLQLTAIIKRAAQLTLVGAGFLFARLPPQALPASVIQCGACRPIRPAPPPASQVVNGNAPSAAPAIAKAAKGTSCAPMAHPISF